MFLHRIKIIANYVVKKIILHILQTGTLMAEVRRMWQGLSNDEKSAYGDSTVSSTRSGICSNALLM